MLPIVIVQNEFLLAIFWLKKKNSCHYWKTNYVSLIRKKLQSKSKVTIFIRVIVYIRIAQRNKIKQKGKERKPALILLANCVWKSEICSLRERESSTNNHQKKKTSRINQSIRIVILSISCDHSDRVCWLNMKKKKFSARRQELT